MPRIEALDSDRQPIDARRPIRGELLRFEGARIRFERDLGVRGERQPRTDSTQDCVDAARREEARRAAAEEDALDAATPHLRQRALEIGHERLDVALLGQDPARLVRIEVAIGALPDAPRDVNVER